MIKWEYKNCHLKSISKSIWDLGNKDSYQENDGFNKMGKEGIYQR